MKELLKTFIGKTLRIYTVSGVESYLDVLEEVHDDYLVLRGLYKGDKVYLVMDCIESFKVEEMKK
jgi:ferredoxin-fold anticodon binding domain-containing protein